MQRQGGVGRVDFLGHQRAEREPAKHQAGHRPAGPAAAIAATASTHDLLGSRIDVNPLKHQRAADAAVREMPQVGAIVLAGDFAYRWECEQYRKPPSVDIPTRPWSIVRGRRRQH